MPKKYKNSKSIKRRTGKSSLLRGLFSGSRVLEIIIASAFILVVLYVASISIRVTGGVSKTIETPEHTIRLQVLNGCGVSGLAGRTAGLLGNYKDPDIEIMIVDTDNFEIRPAPKTLVISRDEDKRVAILLATKLGLNGADVVYKQLENNYRQVTTTLVLGEDWESINLPPKAGKE